MVINHNMSAEYANRLLGVNGLNVNKDIEKLSSGSRINRASDDASGLAVSEKMRAQAQGLRRASLNIQDGISFIQTTEGYLTNTENAILRIRELAIQAANGIYSSEDRLQIQAEVSQLVDEVDRVARDAQFNGLNMLTGRFSGSTGNEDSILFLHTGANMDQRLYLNVGDMGAATLGLRDGSAAQPAGQNGTQPAPAQNGVAGGQAATPAPITSANGFANGKVSIITSSDSNMTIGRVDAALFKVLKQRADLGAYQNRLEMTRKGVDVGAENLTAAQSSIQDADMAKVMSDFVKHQILVQTSSSMVAQANQKNSSILRVIG